MTRAPALSELVRAIAGATAAVRDGALVDLGGLAEAVEPALEAARTAPPSEHAQRRAGLSDLVAALENLAAALARQHHAEAQQRAAAAYGAGEAPASPPDPAA